MKILYISNNTQVDKNEAVKQFKDYCEPVDLFLYTEPLQAQDFLLKNVISKEQKHLDLIITDWKFPSGNSKDLVSWIRNSDHTYSSDNFQFKSLPVLLIEDTIDQSSAISDGFNGVLEDFPNNHLRLKSTITSAVQGWRSVLAGDLDMIGLDPKTQKIYTSHRSSFISYHRLSVLSRKFVDDKAKRLNYIWTNPNTQAIENSNDVFLQKITRLNHPKYLEKEFHEFFKLNPTFIKGEDYMRTPDELLYEKHLYKYGAKKYYDEPDFINKPQEYAMRFPEVFEIKRHTQKLLRYEKQRFITKVKKDFEQVKRYKEYMTSNDVQNQYYVQKYLGKTYSKYEYTLLIGSKGEKEANEDLIDRLKKDLDFDDINLVTYEELLEKHIRLCNRLSEFNIF